MNISTDLTPIFSTIRYLIISRIESYQIVIYNAVFQRWKMLYLPLNQSETDHGRV